MSREEANQIVRETQKLRRSRHALKIALPTAAALGAGAAIAVGSIPGGGGTITGCYADPAPNVDGVRLPITIDGATEPPGALRVIDPTITTSPGKPPDVLAACQKEEKEITWNQSGPTGPTGPTGPQGQAGGQGAPGSPLIGETSFGISGAGKTFLKLDGVQGASSDKFYKEDIPVESFSLGTHATIGSATGGAGAGKASIESFQITKAIDKSSPLLFQGQAAGRAYKEATLYFSRKAGGKEETYLKFDFQDVQISSLQDGQSPGGQPTEEVTFVFHKVTETFGGGGGAGRGSQVSFNLGVNQKL